MEWCDKSCLELNVNKTKEVVVTFSNKQMELPVEIVEEYKYPGTVFDNLMKFTSNTEEIPAAALSPEEAQLRGGQQGHPQNVLLILH